nr:peroxisomal targeting signal 2 receptor [Onthophagus taurus]
MKSTFLTPNRHGYSVRFSPFNPDQLVVATSQYYGLTGGGTLFLLERNQGNLVEVGTYLWPDGLFDVTWSEIDPQTVVTACGDCSLQIWNLFANTPPVILNEHTKEVYSVDWSKTRQQQLIISASWDCTVKLWDPNRKTSLSTFTGHNQLVYNAMWSPHVANCFASVSGEGTLKIWNISSPSTPITTKVHDAEVLSCDWCKYDQNLLTTGGSDGLIRGWDLRNLNQPIFQLIGCEYAVRRVQFSPHNLSVIASVSYDFTTRIWDFNKCPEAIETINHHTEFVYGLDWNVLKKGELADCGWDSLVHVFNCNSVVC